MMVVGEGHQLTWRQRSRIAARSAGADTPSADRMGGTSPSFMAMIARATCSVPGAWACWARASWRTFGPVTGKTGDLLLNALRCDATLGQEGARWLAGRDQSEQEMLAADVTVPEPAGMPQGEGQDGEGLGVAGCITAPRFACRACGARSAW